MTMRFAAAVVIFSFWPLFRPARPMSRPSRTIPAMARRRGRLYHHAQGKRRLSATPDRQGTGHVHRGLLEAAGPDARDVAATSSGRNTTAGSSTPPTFTGRATPVPGLEDRPRPDLHHPRTAQEHRVLLQRPERLPGGDLVLPGDPSLRPCRRPSTSSFSRGTGPGTISFIHPSSMARRASSPTPSSARQDPEDGL